MIDIGKVNKFIVESETSSGYYLKDIDSNEVVFMPPAMAPEDIKLDMELSAFVYLDTSGSLLATTKTPHAVVGEYALLCVLDDSQEFGAFFDWGIEKDLLVPGNEQKVKVHKYEDHIVRICIEEETNRIFGTTKIGSYVEASEFDITEGDEIKIVPAQLTDLGYRSIINKKFLGMIYHSEIFSDIEIGEEYSGVVKKLRDDCLVDAALQVQGIKNLVDSKDVILEMLKQCGGSSTLHDKSSPESIKQMLGMSKKTFKNAIGMLYKEKKIIISKEGIKLTDNS